MIRKQDVREVSIKADTQDANRVFMAYQDYCFKHKYLQIVRPPHVYKDLRLIYKRIPKQSNKSDFAGLVSADKGSITIRLWSEYI